MDLARSIDRLVGLISPATEVRRLRAREAVDLARRSYEGASVSRRTGGWITAPTSQNEAARGRLGTLRNRSRDLVRNNAWALRAAELYEDEVVGTGITPKFEADDSKTAKELEAIWKEWAETTQIDADGRLTVYGLQALAVRTIFESGEVLLRRRWRRPADRLAIPLQIELLEPDHLDDSKDYGRLENGARIQAGIQLSPIGKREGYWLFQDHPGDSFSLRAFESRLVPESEVLHAYRVTRSKQLRGIPALAAVVIAIRDLDEYRDSQVVKQKIAACLAALIQDNAELGEPKTGAGPVPLLPEFLEPGALIPLPPGKTVAMVQPPTVAEYGEFTKAQLRYLSSGLGVTYEALSGDWSDVNFSSGRLGHLQAGRGIDRWRWTVVVSQILDPLVRWVVEAAVISGRIRDGRWSVRWTPPHRAIWDPKTEVPAARDKIRAGMTSLSEVLREQGQDPRSVLEELASDLEMARSLGLRLESDPSVPLRGSPNAPSGNQSGEASKARPAAGGEAPPSE